MNYGENRSWTGPILGSLFINALIVVFLGLFIQYTPPDDPVEKGPIEVEIFDPGGGGGDPAPDEDTIEESQPEEQIEEAEEEIPEPTPEMPTIPDKMAKEEPKPTPKPAVKPKPTHKKSVKHGKGAGEIGQGSGGGQGGGQGTGTGSGVGSGKGTSSDVQVLSRPKPSYPSGARQAGIEGTVIVAATIGTNGRVVDAYVASSSGNNELDQAALNGIRRWRFVPAKREGQAVEAIVQVPVTFALR